MRRCVGLQGNNIASRTAYGAGSKLECHQPRQFQNNIPYQLHCSIQSSTFIHRGDSSPFSFPFFGRLRRFRVWCFSLFTAFAVTP